VVGRKTPSVDLVVETIFVIVDSKNFVKTIEARASFAVTVEVIAFT